MSEWMLLLKVPTGILLHLLVWCPHQGSPTIPHQQNNSITPLALAMHGTVAEMGVVG
jgi:hypothetical protein